MQNPHGRRVLGRGATGPVDSGVGANIMNKKPKEDVQDAARETGRAGGCIKNHMPYLKRNGIAMQGFDQGRDMVRSIPGALAEKRLQIRWENFPWGVQGTNSLGSRVAGEGVPGGVCFQ